MSEQQIASKDTGSWCS